FDCKYEVRWNGAAPGIKRSLFGQLIEGVVELHGVEITNVVIEHRRRFDVGRIVAADPVFVVPAGRADADLRHKKSRAEARLEVIMVLRSSSSVRCSRS